MNTIYILHGWTYTTDKWGSVVSLLKQAGWAVELLKVPGLTDGSDRVWTLEGYVQWLKEQLPNNGPVVLFGHSNGGRIALAFTARYPERVRQLLLMDSAGIYQRGALMSAKRAVFKALASVGKKFTSSERLRKLLYKLARVSDYNNATPHMRQTMAHLIAMDLTPVLEKVFVPTLLIWGAQDTSTPLADGQLMHARIPNSELYVIPDAKHSPHITHPTEVAERILQTLTRL